MADDDRDGKNIGISFVQLAYTSIMLDELKSEDAIRPGHLQIYARSRSRPDRRHVQRVVAHCTPLGEYGKWSRV